MNTTAITALQANTRSGHLAQVKPPSPSPSGQIEAGDTLHLSPEALQPSGAAVPDAVLAAAADLQGSQITLRADFRTIGDYFAENGGRAALDAFMANTFTEAQLRAFPPPVDGLRIDPVAQELPAALTAAVADLKGDQVNLTADLQAIGAYFREHGGREARHAFMESTFTPEQRQALRSAREGDLAVPTAALE